MELTRYVTIGQYLPRESPVHRLDPRTKIAAVTVLTVAVFVVRDFSGYALLTLFLLAVVVASQIPLGYLLRGLRPILFLLLITVVLNVFFSGIRSEEHTSELQSRYVISYAVFCLKKKK